jgi:hypothetical protein
VTIGQLWFGWAAKGAQGINKQQIIAGSGVLTDASNPITLQATAACYLPRRRTFGWVDQVGLRVVFRRRLAGLDGAGRPGRFFVHVLVAEPPTLPPDVLGRLWDADVWMDDIPAEFRTTLDAFTAPEQLRLGDQPGDVDHDELTRLIGGHLANLARGQRSAIATDERTAVAVAVAVADVLPDALALRGFSTDEPEERAHAYDLVAGEPPDGLFAPIAPDAGISATWRAAASLVIEAATGDSAAEAVIRTLTSQAAGRETLAATLHAWAAADRKSSTDERVDPREIAAVLRLAANDVDLALRLIDGDGAARVARAFVDGAPAAGDVLRIAGAHGRSHAMADLLHPLLMPLDPRVALGVLERLVETVPVARQLLLRRLLADWADAGTLQAFGAEEGLGLARSVAATQAGHVDVIDGLTRHPPFAKAIATARDLPVAWRASAVAAEPTALEPTALASALAREKGFAPVVLRHPSPSILDAVAAAVDAAPVGIALQALDAARAFAPGLDADEWSWLVYARLDPRQRLRRVNELVGYRDDAVTIWTERLLDTYVEVILLDAESGVPLPLLRAPFLQHSASRRGAAWARFTQALHEMDDRGRGSARGAAQAGAAIRMLTTSDRDAALEVAVSAIVAGYQSENDLADRMHALRAETLTGHDELALSMARAAARVRHPRRVLWAALWIADRVHRGLVDKDVLDAPVVRQLRVVDDAWARDQLLGRASVLPSKPLRRWASHVTETRPNWKERITRR